MFGLSPRENSPLDGRLLRAAEAGDAPAVEALLEQGARADARDPRGGRTAAHGAAKAGSVRMLQVLKAHGADLEIPDEDGDIPLSLAIRARRPETVRALFELGARPVNSMIKDYDPVYLAAYAGSAEIIAFLREKGCALNAPSSIYTKKTSYIVTPLHAAAMQGHVDCILLLIRLGARVNRGSVPPVFWTVRYRHDEALQALLDAGCCVTREVVREARSLPHSEALAERLETARRKNTPALLDRLAMWKSRWLSWL